MTGANSAWARALSYTKNAAGQTLPGLLDGLADSHVAAPALVSEHDAISYHGLAQRVNAYARWGLDQGFVPGRVICLLMSNRPDYVAIWLALTRIGCTVALLNTSLRGDALLHCVTAAGSDTVIVSDDLDSERYLLLVRQFTLWNWDSFPHHSEDYASLIDVPLPKPNDRALLIYTSGTTGLPKATIITHRRIIEWSFWFAGMMDAQSDDRLYNCLPMYHSVGGVVAVGSMLVRGGSVFIRERFSASHFWDDVVDHSCTLFQYIGELCRYLTLSPAHPKEREHRLRLACGNGMQAGVWRTLQERFVIPHVLEFYAATEGSLSLYNCEGKVGAIGRVPPFLAQHFAVAVIRCDPETRTLLRDDKGFCIRCANDEPGEAISKMVSSRQFDGYTDPNASEQKILRDVFVAGDVWFRSGDLMRKDAAGYYYFVDRLGDTYRWKGENVSTSEVATVLCNARGVIDAAVYGVIVPGNEGRAGMATISTSDQFSFATLTVHLKANLPAYAHPLFIRVRPTLDVTGTFKLTKTELAREGYTGTSDPIWTRNRDGEYDPVI
jgi:fatty-acyl-CoA synthase